jgi:tetratricopeptide (TPR) repeat protein
MDSDTAPEFYTIWSEARTHIEQGDYDKAIEIYKYILIRYNDNDIAVEYANAYLGDIYLRCFSLAVRYIPIDSEDSVLRSFYVLIVPFSSFEDIEKFLTVGKLLIMNLARKLVTIFKAVVYLALYCTF